MDTEIIQNTIYIHELKINLLQRQQEIKQATNCIQAINKSESSCIDHNDVISAILQKMNVNINKMNHKLNEIILYFQNNGMFNSTYII